MAESVSESVSETRNTMRYAYREGWRWPGEVEDWFREKVSAAVLAGQVPVAHIPSGESKLGTIRVDLYSPSANVKADFFKLPFPDAHFGTVVSDPPWEMALPDRFKFCREIGRVLRPGGTLLWCAPFLPAEGTFRIDRVTVMSQRIGLLRNARLLVEATRRTPGPKVGKGQKKAAGRAPS